MAGVAILNQRSSSARVEIIVKLTRHRLADARRSLEILERGPLDRSCSAEVHQQRALAARPDAWNLVKRRRRQALRPLRAMRADGETVCLVAQPLKIEKQRRIRRQGDLAPAGQMKYLATFAAMVR